MKRPEFSRKALRETIQPEGRFAGHCERHTDQIKEVMADPNFPRK